MLRLTALWILRVVAVAAGLFGPSAYAGEDAPAPARRAETPVGDIHIFLNVPADLDALWKSLGQPDFVLKRGGEARPVREPAPGSRVPARPAATVDSVAVEGKVEKDLASLTVELGVTLATPGPVRVPLRLDDAVLTAVHEGDRMREVRSAAGQGWEVELQGVGPHTFRVELRARLKSTADGYRLELPIPEAARTRVQLDIPHRVVDATAGPDEPLEPALLEKGLRTRLAAHLTARSRLDLSWRVEAETGVQLPHLLAMQGEIAVDVDSASLRTRSSWIVQAVRGMTRTLELRLDPDVEVLEVELDGQAPPAGIERVEGGTKLTINLVEALRPGAPKKLTLTTRLALPSLPARVTLHGFTLANAKEQTGAVGIAQIGNLYIQGAAGRGVRQIDPRDLRDDLRVRPATVLAYQFVDQPFELTLGVEPSPPLVRTEARTTVALSGRDAKLETWLDFKTARGRLFETRVGVPKGLELETVGPDDIVESSKLDIDAAGVRVLTVLLKSKARDQGAFSLRLTGRQALDATKPIEVALFRPLDSTSGGGRIAVLTERDLTIDWPASAVGTGEAERFRLAVGEPPSDWPWPTDRVPADVESPPALWLRHDDHPSMLPLQVTVHPRILTHESSLLARVDRQSVEVRQDIVCSVHFGTLEQIELAAPKAIQGLWEIEEGNVSSRKDLGTNAAGEALTRVTFGQPVADRTRLTLRYRLPLTGDPERKQQADVAIPWLRVHDGAEAPLRARVAADAGIDVQPTGTGWTRVEDQESAVSSELGLPVRFTLVSEGVDRPAALRLAVTPRPLAALPPLVIARHWLRTTQAPDLGLRVSAWYWVDTHQGSLPIALPAGAALERVRVGGETREQVESLPQDSAFRIRFPARWAATPVLVGVDYRLDAQYVGNAWAPPHVLDGAIIEETLWEARVPASRTLLGAPGGWSDENTWHWDHYVWKRQPRKNASSLMTWVCGPEGRGQAPDSVELDSLGEAHGFLFGRLSPPPTLHPLIITRFWLLTLCSGGVLAVGSILLLAWRPPARRVIPALAAAVLGAAIVLPASVTFVLVQSALVGMALLVMMAALQRLTERRRSAADLFSEPSRLTPAPGTAIELPGGVGSDDSTAVRVRVPASTLDYVVSRPPTAPERPSGHGSSVRPG